MTTFPVRPVCRVLCAGAVLLASAGCGPRPPASPTPGEAPQRVARVDTVARPLEDVLDPARYLAVLEEHMVHRPSCRIAFRITSEGAVAAALAGELQMLRDGDVRLNARGTMRDDSVALALALAEGRITGGNGTRSFDEPAPGQLRDALLIGMMRMGLLHQLARLAEAQPPEHADTDARTWAELRDVVWLPRDTHATRRGLSYTLVVAGAPSGEGVLWLDARGRPVARELTVHFPDGDMRVHEEYEVR